ncbi:MAG: biotin/lipoyl-binding protein, partial [Deltaproteobacteria bacterium]|nr:biotin/lipoyl-binding protein [Deltaproteobacteria bacterium]
MTRKVEHRHNERRFQEGDSGGCCHSDWRLGCTVAIPNGGAQVGGRTHTLGNIDIRDVQPAFSEQERIAEVLVEEGDRVQAGQVLARQQTNRLEAQIKEAQARIAAQQQVVNRMEAGTRRQEIEQAQAEVAAAKAKAKNSGRRFERIRKTTEAGATSRQAE